MTESESFLATARQVITDEARALDVLAGQLDQGFVDTLRLMLDATGRIIVNFDESTLDRTCYVRRGKWLWRD